MELTDLRYFGNVASARSFSKGARLSHVSASAISKTIQKLEEELGCLLFTRTTRRVELTEAGLRLQRRCIAIFAEVDGLRADVAHAEDAVVGELRIGAMEVFSTKLLPAALSELVGAHPLVVPSAHEMVPQEMERLLGDGRLDVAFTIGATRTRGVTVLDLGRSPGVLVCGRGHPLYRGGVVRAADLERHPFVVPRFLGLEQLPALDQFPERAHPRTVGATIELMQMGIELATGGRYLGFFPEVCVREQLQQRRLRALRGMRFGVSFDLQALVREGAEPKRAARLLIDGVRVRVRAARA
jgi:DNA-binding transcriptional LysR family regulator